MHFLLWAVIEVEPPGRTDFRLHEVAGSRFSQIRRARPFGDMGSLLVVTAYTFQGGEEGVDYDNCHLHNQGRKRKRQVGGGRAHPRDLASHREHE